MVLEKEEEVDYYYYYTSLFVFLIEFLGAHDDGAKVLSAMAPFTYIISYIIIHTGQYIHHIYQSLYLLLLAASFLAHYYYYYYY